MKTISARTIALLFVLAFGMTASVSKAALTASTGVSLTPITLTDAYYGSAPDHLNVSTNPGQIYLSFRVANGGEYFTLNSVTIDVTLNGIQASSEKYSTYEVVDNWNRIGVYGDNSYGVGQMNQGLILIACGTQNSVSPYSTAGNPAGVWQYNMTYDIQGQSPVTSFATVTYIPEPTTTTIAILGTSLCFLRRKRM